MKSLIKYINFKKACALLTILSFLLLTINSNLYALTVPQPINNQLNSLFETSNLIQQKFGKVTNFKDLGSNITVINIQDLHCHLQTQKNINEILNELDNIKPIDIILAEGGYEKFNLDWIKNLKDKKIKEDVIQKLLYDNNITGTEYYVLHNNKENILKGLDKQSLHQKNLARLNFIISKKNTYSDILKQVNQEIFILNNKYINQRNRRFSKILTDYNNGKISSTKFYKLLFKYVNTINKNNNNYNNVVPILTNSYPNISKFLNIYSTSSEINPKVVTSQLQSFIYTLKNSLPYDIYNKLLAYTDNFSNTFKLAEFIKKYSNEFDIDITTQFPELSKFLENLKLSEDLNPIQLLKEEEHLVSQIRMALSYDNTEYEITFISDFFNYFEKYLNYSLTAYDWQYYKDNYDKFIELYSKYSNINRIKFIEKDFDEINSYYETNNIRNDVFVSNIVNNINTEIKNIYTGNRDLITTLKQSDKILVVVAGGFHSEELKDFLLKKDINIITITPTITEDTTNAKIQYEENIKIQNKVLSQALALRMAASATEIEQQTLLARVALQIYGDRDITNLEQLLNNKIKISKIKNGIYVLNFENGQEIEINLQNNATQEEKEVSFLINNSINSILDIIPNFLPTKGLQSIFVPETYLILKNLSLQLFKHNIYLADGVVIDIENSEFNEQDIDGIQPEIYSTFLPEIQKLLLNKVKPKPLLSLTNKATLKQVVIEELFRIIPMAISIINPLIGIPVFVLSQFLFVYAHSITNYIHAKTPDKTISVAVYFNQLKNIVLNKDIRNDFIKHLKDKETSKYLSHIGKQTIILSLPYLFTILANIVCPASVIILPITSSLISVFIHYKHNISNAKNLSIIDSQKDTEGASDNIKEDNDIATILILTFAINIILALLSTASPAITFIHFVFLIFPINSSLTLLWSFLNKSYQKRIFGKEHYESKYFSNIPEEDYDYSQGTMDVTIQIPIYTESNKVVFETIKQSLEAAANYKGRSFGAKANVLVSDDGLAVLLDGDISQKHIKEILSKPVDELSDKEKQAVERIIFYRENNISFIARPKENRAGLFKKASNLNHTYRTVEKIKNNISVEDGTYYEGEELEVYDIILLLDKDSGLHKDILSVSVPKFIKNDKLAYTENVTVPSNREDNYFSKTIAAFTAFLYQYIYPSNALTGGIVPFVGHNGFIRKSALEEVGFWPEDRVSEDYYISTLFSARGYHGQYLNFKGYEFTEVVSRSFIEESYKIARYTFGILELIFNKNILKWQKDGVITDWMKEFLFSKHIKWYQKIHFFIYPLSYVNIISIIPAAIITGLFLNSGTFNLMVLVIGAIPLIVALHKIYDKTNLLPNQEKNKRAAILKNIFRDVVIIVTTFISFSHVMLTSVINFFHNPNKAKFGATNVDDDTSYTLKEALAKIKSILRNYKSIFIYIAPFIIKFILMPSSILNLQNTIIPFIITFALVLSNIILNPFLINSLKNKISSIFMQGKEKIKIIYSTQKNTEQQAYPLSLIDTKTKTLQVFIANDISKFNKRDLVNTGLKAEGKIIWQVKNKNSLIFVADGLNSNHIIRAINNSWKLKQHIKKILNLRNNINVNIDAALIIDDEIDDTYMEDNILTTNSDNFTTTFSEIIRVLGIVFARKTMISLADISEENLYQAISNGSLKKVITEKQFKYLKDMFESKNKDIFQEITFLREKGIEIYVIADSDNFDINDNYYKQFGFSGKIKGSTIYDYFSQEEIEIETIPGNIQIKELEKKIIYSETPLLIKLKDLQNLFSIQNNILDTYNTFDSLLGKIKIKLGFKNIKTIDIKEFAYNINLSLLPNIDENEIETMLNLNIADFTSNLNIQSNNIISVILNDTKISDENKNIFLDIIKQKLLIKIKLQKQNIEVINDKKLERMLGQLLLIQYKDVSNEKERTIVNDAIFDAAEKEIEEKKKAEEKGDYVSKIYMNKINDLYISAVQERDIISVNTIIEIILFLQDRKISVNEEDAQISVIDYKQMLAAA